MASLDPTRAELLERIFATFSVSLESSYSDYADNDFDVESALYWFANDYHAGQWSNLYSVLSTSEYKPSPLASGIASESELGQEIYQFLVDIFVKGN